MTENRTLGFLGIRRCEDDETIAPGWNNQGFPEFELDGPALLECIWCAVDGGDVFLLMASNSDEAKDILLPAVQASRTRYAKAGMKIFEPPASWCVRRLQPVAGMLGAWSGAFKAAPYLDTLRDMAQRVAVQGVIEEGCGQCGFRFPETETKRIQFSWSDSTIGDSFHWTCPECGETNFLSNTDF
jgi:hypothetical protein